MNNVKDDKEMLVWDYKGLKVFYYLDLDGDGTNQAPSFVTFIKSYFPKNKVYEKVFEWCAGPGFIGFALLKEGICKKLCLADINPLAIECVKRTIIENNLQDYVSYYVSNNFESIPQYEKFDLVVSNPPNYYHLNPEHYDYDWLKDDLRPNDPGWEIHKSFYNSVKNYLLVDAYLLIQEVEPFADKVYIPATGNVAFDIRPEAPHKEFVEMINTGGLKFIDTKYFHMDEQEKIKMWMMISKN